MMMTHRPIVSRLLGDRRKFTNIILAALAFCAVFALGSAKADAATVTVSGGCSLESAVDSINAGSNQGSCVATGSAYGTSDTISLPAGTHAFTNAIDAINRPVIFEGAGAGQTTLDLSGSTTNGLNFDNTTGSLQSVIIRDMALIDGDNGIFSWLEVSNFSATLQRLEFYSTSAPNDESSFVINIDGGLYAGQENLIEDVYLHDLTVDSNLISIDSAGPNALTENLIRQVTVHDIEFTSVQGSGVISIGGTGAGAVEALIENVTLQDVDFAEQGALVTAAAIAIGADNKESVVTLRNSTIRFTRLTTTPNPFGLVVPSAVALDGLTATAEITAQNNVLITNGYANVAACAENELNLGGTASATLLSLGGNLSDDDSCNGFFTEPSDESEIANLGDTLDELDDNGGFTPTAALLEGSPAIDAGLTIAGLTVDQRGTSRPQGAGYDSGAYEFVLGAQDDDDDDGQNNDDDDPAPNQNNNNNQQPGNNNGQNNGDSNGLASTGVSTLVASIIAGIVAVGSLTAIFFRRRLAYKRVRL